MSGDIEDMPIRRCPSCGLVFVEDGRMYQDTTVCPRCGADLSAEAAGE
jgi:rubredoxin